MRVFQVTGFFIRFPWTPGFFISDLFVNFAYVNRHLPYMKQRYYIAIDLKSFYASVECVERGLNPLDACLVVADKTRTDKTICLAVSPALKAYGVPGRPRLFEVMQRVGEVIWPWATLWQSPGCNSIWTIRPAFSAFICVP